MKSLMSLLGKDRKRPLDYKPKLETRQMSLEDFNSELNNNSNTDVMRELDVDHISFGRGDGNDEEE